MWKQIGVWLVLFVLAVGLGRVWLVSDAPDEIGAPPGGVAEAEVPEDLGPYGWLSDWERPEGPAKVALQVGHWQNDDFPEELARLRNNDGATGGGVTELSINLVIVELMKGYLEEAGVEVEVLPATVPPDYWADVFVSVHADGNEDWRTRGYKFAGPWRDFTGKSERLVEILSGKYESATGLPFDPNISRNMRGYYAFAWWRYEYSLHPMTTAVIAETGFVSNPTDRKLLTEEPEVAAGAMAEALIEFLRQEKLLS